MQRRCPGAAQTLAFQVLQGGRMLVLGAMLAATAQAASVRISGPDDDHHFGEVGNSASGECRLNHNGRYVLFTSAANDLVPDDDNRARDLFLRDRQLQTTVRLNRSAEETDGQPVGAEHDISGDGNRIVFIGTELLGSAEPNGVAQVLLLDRGDGSVRLVSHTLDDGPVTGTVDHPRISANGDFVVFTANGGDLVAGVLSLSPQVYRYEVATGAIMLVSQSAGGAVANGASYAPTLSVDGNRVAFATSANNLLTDGAGVPVADGNGEMDAVFKSFPSGRVRLASVDAAGLPLADGASDAAISGDGFSIAFTSNDAALRSDPANPHVQLYVRRLGAGSTTQAVSLDDTGAMADGPVSAPEISEDGRWIAFLAEAPNLDGGPSAPTLVLRDTATGLTTTPGSRTANGAPAVSGDGTLLCKETAVSTEADVEDNNGSTDVFIHETGGAGVVDVASVSMLPTTWAGGHSPGMSADGAVVVFASSAANIIANLPSSRRRVTNLIRFDVATGTRTLVLPHLAGTALEGNLDEPVLSADATQLFFRTSDGAVSVSGNTLARVDMDTGALLHVTPTTDAAGLDASIDSVRSSGDGRAAVFVSDATNLQGAPPLPPHLVYLWREGIGLQVVSRVPGGPFADANSRVPAISRDGRCVAFSSDASTLATPELPGEHIYLYRVDDDSLERIDAVTDNSQAVQLAFDANCGMLYAVRELGVAAKGGVAGTRLQRYDVALGTWSDLATDLTSLESDVLAASGDGRYLVLAAGAPVAALQLWRFDTHSGASRAVTPPITNSLFDDETAVSDDGQRIVFAANDDTLDPRVIDNNGDMDVYLTEMPGSAMFGDGFE